MAKNEQAEIRKLVGKICDVCMRINQETERAAFCYISGHVSQISVCICVSKKDYTDYIMRWDAYYDEKEWNTPSQIIKNLTDRLAALENFLAAELAK